MSTYVSTNKKSELKNITAFFHCVDSSKRWNDAENLTLLNKSFDFILVT